MKLGLILIAILTSACGKRFEDAGISSSSADVRSRINSLSTWEKQQAETIKPYVGNFLGVREAVNWKKSNAWTEESLDNYINSQIFDSKIYDIQRTINQQFTFYFETKANIEKFTGKPFVGVCWRDIKTVAIQKEWWDSVSDDWKKLLILHEMGHCYLKRPHEGSKESVMEAVLIYTNEYTKRKNYYDCELFYPLQQPPCL